MAKISTGLRNAMMGTNHFKALMDSCKVMIYAGTVPADADAAVGAATLIYEVTVDGGATLCTWDAPVAGVIEKAAAETWSDDAITDGTLSFFRVVKDADDGTLSTTAYRVQGTVGTGAADMLVGTLERIESDPIELEDFSIELPAG